MIEIDKGVEVGAPIEVVWTAVSDLENEHRPWEFLRDVKLLDKTENSIRREVKIRRGPMGEATSVQTLKVDPVKRSTTLSLTDGPMLGDRTLLVSSLGEGRTSIKVHWEFEMKGVPGFAKGFVKDNVSEATTHALAEIASQAEAAAKRQP
jgi:carbon monoxide dehydrogenase subunit G